MIKKVSDAPAFTMAVADAKTLITTNLCVKALE
jgi:hypothetical protein